MKEPGNHVVSVPPDFWAGCLIDRYVPSTMFQPGLRLWAFELHASLLIGEMPVGRPRCRCRNRGRSRASRVDDYENDNDNDNDNDNERKIS